ncbi:4Fe-4S dicluster domain-containing protein [Sinanaerobacter chloroacetimidivorans]|uniref:4Fe-4S dicluster domain-containing protein n=1 Tax=Sinanaerobacter chloroacetimidivorans TaxID=2818044 RepID=A0A8J7W5F4_9FIRM|nr:4Fe-4S dicluster domain-containing protein [Sinanaerobacter chloroacetimidivorans]MBR0599386.1 4Fe-4S dicluster domain-containing protein [Sinanaerobacter chloroacetimidivorans]
MDKKPSKLPWVIPVNCEGCGGCVNYCKNGSLKMKETNIEGVFVPWLDEPQKCSGCGRCTKACVMGAITMTSFVDQAMKRFLEQKPEIRG